MAYGRSVTERTSFDRCVSVVWTGFLFRDGKKAYVPQEGWFVRGKGVQVKLCVQSEKAFTLCQRRNRKRLMALWGSVRSATYSGVMLVKFNVDSSASTEIQSVIVEWAKPPCGGINGMTMVTGRISSLVVALSGCGSSFGSRTNSLVTRDMISRSWQRRKSCAMPMGTLSAPVLQTRPAKQER